MRGAQTETRKGLGVTAVKEGTLVLISQWDSLMFGRVPGTRPNMRESHSEISTRVPFCIATRIVLEGRRGHRGTHHLLPLHDRDERAERARHLRGGGGRASEGFEARARLDIGAPLGGPLVPCEIKRESLKSLTVATRQHMPMNLRLVLMAPVLYSSPRPSPPRQGAPAYSLALAIESVPVRVFLK